MPEILSMADAAAMDEEDIPEDSKSDDGSKASSSTAQSLVALHSLLGLYCIMVVKQACSRYPKEHLIKWGDDLPYEARGTHKVLRTAYKKELPRGLAHMGLPDPDREYPAFAFGWKDRKAICLVANVGTTLPGEPFKRPRWTKQLSEDGKQYVTVPRYRTIPCPEVVRRFYKYFSAIDIHDHLRQGSLAVHQNWHTQCWWHRVYSNVIAIAVVDAFLMYRYYATRTLMEEKELVNFTVFVDQLAHQLATNVLDVPAQAATRHPRVAQKAPNLYRERKRHPGCKNP
jgi:hypothetical protein